MPEYKITIRPDHHIGLNWFLWRNGQIIASGWGQHRQQADRDARLAQQECMAIDIEMKQKDDKTIMCG